MEEHHEPAERADVAHLERGTPERDGREREGHDGHQRSEGDDPPPGEDREKGTRSDPDHRGSQHEEHAEARRDTFATAAPEPRSEAVPEHRRRSDRVREPRQDRDLGRELERQRDRERALQGIEQQHDEADALAHVSRHVRRTDVSTPDRADVDASSAGSEPAKWHRAAEERECDEREGHGRSVATKRGRITRARASRARTRYTDPTATRRHARAETEDVSDKTTQVVRVLARIGDVDAAAWNRCTRGDPFVSHEFLLALEESGSASPETGWTPRHVVVEDETGVIAAAPAYLKAHSYGEYVFDFAWAEAFHRVGLEYYPKLQSCVPFTPATGPRLLVREGLERAPHEELLVAALAEVARREGASSLHITFPTEAECDRGHELGLLRRAGLQYHWHNRGYGTFDDFLGELLGRKRRILSRERRDANAAVRIETLRGDELGREEWNAFYGFYRDTIARKWGQAYLTRAFFEVLGTTMAERVAMVVARQDDRIVAAALNLIGPDALFGRYWGASVDVPFLHFELCYYRAIELAIALGLPRVEAGAQGEHKLARGYVPVETHSLHQVAEPRLRAAIGSFLEEERRSVRQVIAELEGLTPYRDRPVAR